MPNSAESEIQMESLSNKDTFEYFDLSVQEKEYAEALKNLQLATKRLLSFSSAPLGGVQKNENVNSGVNDLNESEIELESTTFNDMADKSATNMPLAEITSTSLPSSVQITSSPQLANGEQKTSKDLEKTQNSVEGTEIKDSVTQSSKKQLNDISENKLMKGICTKGFI